MAPQSFRKTLSPSMEKRTVCCLTVILILAHLLLRCNACGSEPVVYQVTVRDFLPIWCMPLEDLVSLEVDDPDIYDSDSLRRETYNRYQGEGECPYQEYIDRGEISGHPDFMRPYHAGWDMQFLFDLEDKYGVNTLVNGTCDLNDVNVVENRPPFLNVRTATGSRAVCYAMYKAYTPRMNYSQMDVSPSGLPKPQYCTKDPAGRCGYHLRTMYLGGQSYGSANKHFQDMWFNDNKKYNKRIGTTLHTKEVAPECRGLYHFDSNLDQESPRAANNAYAPHALPEYTFDKEDHPDPFEAKAWPKFESALGQVKGAQKYLHTSEIHTFFEYRGDEVFSFSGDDDVWVYVNGILAIELGGVHLNAEQLINLGHPAALEHFNITPGEIYTFDLFQAERQPRGSNFRMSSTLVSACNVLASKKHFFPSQRGNSVTKSRHVDFEFTEGSVYDGREIELLSSGYFHLSTFVFVQEKINVASGFIVDFTFTARGNPEGFAFVLHRRPEGLKNFPISSGGGLGFTGIKQSVAIAFDLCSDRKTSVNCTEQKVAIHYPETLGSANKPGESTRRVHDSIVRSLKLGDEHHVKILYYFRPSALEVIIDDSLYLRDMPFDPRKALGSVGAFAGFTAAAGDRSGKITISKWAMYSVDVEPKKTKPLDFTNSENASFPRPMVGDNLDSASYSIQTQDICGFSVEFGNRADNTAGVFVEEKNPATGEYASNRTEPLVVDAIVTDNLDGTYTYTLKLHGEGVFSLYFYYGGSSRPCSLEAENYGFGAGHDGCFRGSVLYAVEVRPPRLALTRSPAVFTLSPVAYDVVPVYIGAIGGVTLAVLGVVATVFVFAYKRRWEMEKQFIEKGEMYRLDADVILARNDKRSRIGRKVLATRAGILMIRAQKSVGSQEEELGVLETENEELKEQIYQAEQKVRRKSSLGSLSSLRESLTRMSFRPARKIEM